MTILLRCATGTALVLLLSMTMAGSASAANCDKNPSHWSCSPGGGGGGGGGETDTTAPATIQQIAVDPIGNAVTLYWITPGDDGWEGQAAHYDIRYSTSPITSESEFNNATLAPRGDTYVPLPTGVGAAGETEPCELWDGQTSSQFCDYFVVRNLNAETPYYFAVKVMDEAGNLSGMQTAEATTTSTPYSIDAIDMGIDDTYRYRSVMLAHTANGYAMSHLIRDGETGNTSSGGDLVMYRTITPGGPSPAKASIGLTPWFSSAMYTGPLKRRVSSGDRLATVISGFGPRKKGKSNWQHVYLEEQADGSWTGEIAVSSRNLRGVETDLGFDALGSPMIPYVINDSHELWVARREAQGWDQQTVLSCGSGTGPSFKDAKTGTTSDGRVWVLSYLAPEGQGGVVEWLVLAVENGASWDYYTTRAVKDVTFNMELAFDSQGTPYIAAAVRQPDSPADDYVVDVVMFSGLGISATSTPCDAPAFAVPGVDYEVVDSVDSSGDDFVEGSSLVGQNWGFIHGLWIEPAPGGAGDDIHLATSRDNGNSVQKELRLLSRCAGSAVWLRDPVDRSHAGRYSDDFGLVTLDDGGVAWAYDWGRTGRFIDYGPSYDPYPTPSLLFAHREGNPCTAP